MKPFGVPSEDVAMARMLLIQAGVAMPGLGEQLAIDQALREQGKGEQDDR